MQETCLYFWTWRSAFTLYTYESAEQFAPDGRRIRVVFAESDTDTLLAELLLTFMDISMNPKLTDKSKLYHSRSCHAEKTRMVNRRCSNNHMVKNRNVQQLTSRNEFLSHFNISV